jgi:hypothetical protein
MTCPIDAIGGLSDQNNLKKLQQVDDASQWQCESMKGEDERMRMDLGMKYSEKGLSNVVEKVENSA